MRVKGSRQRVRSVALNTDPIQRRSDPGLSLHALLCISHTRSTMSDARSLLRAKKATAMPKVDSPYATYREGELRCLLCAVKGNLTLIAVSPIFIVVLTDVFVWVGLSALSSPMDGPRLIQAAPRLTRKGEGRRAQTGRPQTPAGRVVVVLLLQEAQGRPCRWSVSGRTRLVVVVVGVASGVLCRPVRCAPSIVAVAFPSPSSRPSSSLNRACSPAEIDRGRL